MPKFLKKLMGRLGSARWIAIPMGGLLLFASAFSFWFVFQLRDFASVMRDNLESPPGLLECALFAAVCAGLGLTFWLGICCIVLGVRGGRGT